MGRDPALTLSAILVLALAPVRRGSHNLPIPESDNHRLLSVQRQYSGLMAASARVVHSIICCRILLNLKRAASPRNTSAEAEVSTGLAFATSPGQQTNQTETIGLETVGTRRQSDEEDSRRQADGDVIIAIAI